MKKTIERLYKESILMEATVKYSLIWWDKRADIPWDKINKEMKSFKRPMIVDPDFNETDDIEIVIMEGTDNKKLALNIVKQWDSGSIEDTGTFKG